MAAKDIAQYLGWAQFGMAALVVVLALVTGLRAARPRHVRPAAIAAPVLTMVAIAAAAVLGGFRLAPVVVGIAVVAGAAVGFLAGRSAEYGDYQGKRVVKPSAAVAWANALAVALLALGVALAGPNTASLMAAVALGAAAMALVESVMHLAGVRSVVR